MELDNVWIYVDANYEIIEKVGQGSFGLVVKAKDRRNGKMCAIKLIKEVFYNVNHARSVCRELQLMRYLSTEWKNIYTVKLRDVVIPPMSSSGQKEGEKNGNKIFEDLFLV